MYELERSIKDVFVEGVVDAGVIRWFLRESGLRSVSVFDINQIQVPPELLAQNGLENNNRGRVICLATELEARSAVHLPDRVVCIVDIDLDFILNPVAKPTLVVTTDYPTLEGYVFNPKAIGKLISVVLGEGQASAESVLASMTPVLHELFLVRVVKQDLNLNIREVSFERCCILDGGIIRFDLSEFLVRYLNSGGIRHRVDEFRERLEGYRSHLGGDPRRFVNGRDFVELFIWYAKERNRSRQIPNVDIFTRTVFLTLEHSDLLAEPMFQALLTRLA